MHRVNAKSEVRFCAVGGSEVEVKDPSLDLSAEELLEPLGQ